MADSDLLLKPQPSADRRVEIARSFSYKLNVGNYESRDFFCSQKSECSEAEAEDVSERMYIFCRSQVLKAVAEYQRLRVEQQQRHQHVNGEEKQHGYHS